VQIHIAVRFENEHRLNIAALYYLAGGVRVILMHTQSHDLQDPRGRLRERPNCLLYYRQHQSVADVLSENDVADVVGLVRQAADRHGNATSVNRQ
jgi:hypothetical protein